MADYNEDNAEHLQQQCLVTGGTWYLPDGPCRYVAFEDAETAPKDEDGLPKAGLRYTGLTPTAPTTVNEQGGHQSVVEGRFDLLPPVAMFELARVMEHGAKKYAPNNWRKIPVESHVNHALMHLFAWLAGDRQDQHLTHVLARAAMAVELDTLEGGDAEQAY